MNNHLRISLYYLLALITLGSQNAFAQLDCPTDPGAWDSSSVDASTDSIPYTQRNWVCGLSEMTKELSAMSMAHTRSIGTLFDAQNHIQTKMVLNKQSAIAHKNYVPSEQVCRISTLGKNLSANEAAAQTTQLVLNNFLLERDLGSDNSGDKGKGSQVQQFERTYCNFYSNGLNGLEEMCDTDYRNAGTVNPGRFNRDIDYTSLIDMDHSLNLNFTDSDITDDETDILAMSRLLYLHNPLHRPSEDQLKSIDAPHVITDQRALLAKYNVAKNSFTKIVSMKTAGSDTVTPYLKNAMSVLVDPSTPEYIDNYVGENPSYDTQMEILTKKIYQNPAFYSSLIDTPANINRQKAAMAGIKLMQDRDFLESMLRREMLLSLILEVKLSEAAADQESNFYDPDSPE